MGRYEPQIKGKFIADSFGEPLDVYKIVSFNHHYRGLSHDDVMLLMRVRIVRYRLPIEGDTYWYFETERDGYWRMYGFHMPEKWNGNKRRWVPWGQTAPKWVKKLSMVVMHLDWRKDQRETERTRAAIENGKEAPSEGEQLSLFSL